jgi:hypothetical protein
MEQLQIRADRFRKQGRLQDKDQEEIIKGIKENKGIKDDEGDDKAATAATDKHNKVLEAVEEGLLQVHGTAPNMKQQGIFRIMGKNCNGFNNRIGRYEKIAKALDIKEDLDINCLTYCEHHINFRHKETKLISSKCSNVSWHAWQSWLTMSTKQNVQGEYREEGQVPFALGTLSDTSRKWGETTKGLAGGGGFS